jgi:hypothetical protein
MEIAAFKKIKFLLNTKMIPKNMPTRMTGLILFSLAGLFSFIPSGGCQESIEVNALAINPDTGDPLELTEIARQANLNNFYILQKKLVYHILSQLGIEKQDLTPEVLFEINKVPTQNLAAFISFSKGLEFLDKQEFLEAKTAFKRAAKQDSSFTLAKIMAQAVPDHEMSVYEVTSNAVINGQNKTREKLSNINNKSDPELMTSQAVEDFANPEEQAKIAIKISENQNNLNYQETILASLTQATQGHDSNSFQQINSIGYFVTTLLKGIDDEWVDVLDSAYLNTAAIDLKSQDFIIPQTGDANGYLTAVSLQNSTNNNLNNYNRKLSQFKDGESGNKNDLLNNLLYRQTLQSYPANEETIYLQTGYYLYSGWNADCDNQNGCQYFYDRLYFAEGIPTSKENLSELFSKGENYSYSGTANGDILKLDHSTGDLKLETSQTGTFNGSINFATKTVNDFSIKLETENYQVNLTANQLNIADNGNFSINRTEDAQVEIGEKNNLINGTSTNLSGQVFGPDAAAVGGVFSTNQKNDQTEWSSVGNFGGKK